MAHSAAALLAVQLQEVITVVSAKEEDDETQENVLLMAAIANCMHLTALKVSSLKLSLVT